MTNDYTNKKQATPTAVNPLKKREKREGNKQKSKSQCHINAQSMQIKKRNKPRKLSHKTCIFICKQRSLRLYLCLYIYSHMGIVAYICFHYQRQIDMNVTEKTHQNHFSPCR